jgi:WD repeat-containing protein 68
MFTRKAKFGHRYAPTKILWIPDNEGKYPDLLATSGENLKIWEYDD